MKDKFPHLIQRAVCPTWERVVPIDAQQGRHPHWNECQPADEDAMLFHSNVLADVITFRHPDISPEDGTLGPRARRDLIEFVTESDLIRRSDTTILLGHGDAIELEELRPGDRPPRRATVARRR